MNKEQGFLLALLVVSIAVSVIILMPFLQYIIAGVIIAYVLYPVNKRLVPYLGERLAPLVVVPAAIVVVAVPLAYITLVLTRDLMALSRGETDLAVADMERTVRKTTGQEIDVADSLSTLGSDTLNLLFGNVRGAVSAGLTASIGATLTLFLVYYLLRDGEQLVDWLIGVAPMSNAVCSRLFERISRTTWGVIVGHIFVAILQGIVGGIGLLIAGIPNVVFWSFVMIVLSLLPLIGAFFVWAPAAGYLFVVDQTTMGVFLLLYGMIVVSMVDNYARPIIIDRGAHLNPAVVLVGVFGGVYAIGATGLFIGPIVFAVLAATITAFDEEFDALAGADET